jgi:hypothetical protein
MNQFFSLRSSLAAVLFGLASLHPAHAVEIVSVVTDAKISCDAPFELKNGTCVVDAAALAKLDKAETCKGEGLAFDKQGGKCIADPALAPTPKCTREGEQVKFDAQVKQCVLKREPLRSTLGDSMGDCYRVHVTRKSTTKELVAGKSYKVMFQDTDSDGKDKTLTLVESEDKGTLWCDPRRGAELFDVKASELTRMGADRAGWAFGVLAVPFKYYGSSRTFGSGTAIGPYVGRRWGTPGSAYTFAVAATLSSVKGEIRDADDKITSTPDLQAFSLATGFMWDIAKAPEVRAFKWGVFIGADWVGSDKVVQFKQNRKPWIAIQIGFDFLDN